MCPNAFCNCIRMLTAQCLLNWAPFILCFLDHEGKLLRNIINEDGNPKYQYYYSSDEPIVQSMKKVLQIYSETDEHDDDEEENTSSKKSNSSKVEL